jgi:hypothetical protein
MAVNMKLAVFLDVVPCSMEKQQVLFKMLVLCTELHDLTSQKTIVFSYLSFTCVSLTVLRIILSVLAFFSETD